MLQNLPLFPRQGSTLAGDVDAIYFFAVGVAVFFSLLIAALVITFAVRYRRKHADEIGNQEEHPTHLLEITWSAIPLAILLVMFGWGAKVYFTAARVPNNALEFYVVGKQWMWKFQHPEGNREINDLHVPVGVPIKLIMTSEDVIHSFFVPEFRHKVDVIPGRYRTYWFQATAPGTYRIFCAEYCGAEHSLMIGHVIAMPPAEYEAWLAGGRPGQSMAASGKDLFTRLACDTCHRTDSNVRAPYLQNLLGSEVRFTDGSTRVADETYIRESILDPTAHVVAGYNPIMPTFRGQITEDELVQLVLYVKSLSPNAAGAAPAAGQTAGPATGGFTDTQALSQSVAVPGAKP